MTKNKAIEASENYFKHYPKVDTFHFTTDGNAFVKKTDADTHAAFLNKQNPVVFIVNRGDKVEEAETTEETTAPEAVVTSEQAETTEDATPEAEKAIEAKKGKNKGK